MNKLFLIPAAIVGLAALCSCSKQQTDAERDADVERRVQERLAAEKQTQQQQQLDQRQADLDAREKTLADKENSAAQASTNREESESRERVSRPQIPRQGEMTTGYTTFYNRLEPYGDWIGTDDYGYVFHPREASSSSRWRPYTDGRWVYTDAGWTWISEEPFGWATYHYGRWTRLRGIGWVWVPGNEWAPAWVSWRKSNDYVGWAPLPPEARFDQRTGIRNWSDSYYDVGPDQYCFVASREFGAPRVEQTLLPPDRNVAIINQTTNVTNITYNNTTIINEGPNYDEVRAISREPVQRYRLERNVNVNVSAQLPRSEVRGETVVVAAPVIAAPAATERPPTVKQTVTAAAVDLGWAAIANQDDAKKTRQKMKSEATPPPNAPPKKFVRDSGSTIPPVGRETPAATFSPPTMSPPQSVAPVTTSTPRPVMTPQSVGSVSPAPASASPSLPQHRERRMPFSIAPTPNASAAATASPTPVQRPTAAEQPTAVPIPRESSGRNQFKSQGQAFNPRKVEPMPSNSPSSTPMVSPSKGWTGRGFKVPNESQSASPSATSASAGDVSTTPAESSPETPSKQEKKELKAQIRAERKELKRERKEGVENAAPSATP